MPRGETDFWVHMPAGQPLLVIHNPSQSSFREVLTQGFDFTTNRKGPYAPLPDDQFQTVTYVVGPRGEPVAYELVEAVFAEPGWPTLRLRVGA